MSKGNNGRWCEWLLRSGDVLLLNLSGTFSVSIVNIIELYTYDLHIFLYVFMCAAIKSLLKRKIKLLTTPVSKPLKRNLDGCKIPIIQGAASPLLSLAEYKLK